MNFSLKPGPPFVDGVDVELFAASDWPASTTQPAGAPPGAAVATETIGADGTVSFTAIDAGNYWAVAHIGSVYYYIDVDVTAPPSPAPDVTPSEVEGQVLTTVDGAVAWADSAGGGGGAINVPEEGLTLVRGALNFVGENVTGEGFTVSYDSGGDVYTITWDAAWAVLDQGNNDIPDVSFNATVDGSLTGSRSLSYVHIVNGTEDGVEQTEVTGLGLTSGVHGATSFSFIAIGKLA